MRSLPFIGNICLCRKVHMQHTMLRTYIPTYLIANHYSDLIVYYVLIHRSIVVMHYVNISEGTVVLTLSLIIPV